MAEVGSAYVSLMPSAKGFGSAMQSEIGPQVDGVGKSVGSKFGTLFKVGALAAVGGAFVVGKFLKGAVDEAREAQIVTARTENVIKRMGNVAGISAKQVGNLAGAISRKTGIDDEAIQTGANLLLTFGNIRNEAGKGNDIFNRTTQLMTDMSAAMGTDAKGSAIQLGKALNDPVKGVTALTRVGVSFTEGQKKQIEALVESGNTLKAQKLILGEVEKQFGGAAEAMATPADKVAVAWGNVKEQIGTALLPVIDNVLNKVLTWMPAITAGIDTAMAAVRGWVTSAQALFSGGDGLGGGASSFTAILTGTVLPAIQQAVTYLRDQLLPAVMGVVNAFKYEFQTIAPIVVAAIQGMVARIAPHWEEIKAGLIQVVQTFKSSLELIAVIVRTGTDILQTLWRNFGQRFMDYLATTFLNVVQIVRGALNIVQGVIRLVTSLIKGDWSGAWDAIKQILRGAWQIIEGLVRQGINTTKNMLQNLGSVLKAIFSKAWDLAKDAVQAGIRSQIDVMKALPGRIKSALGDLGGLLVDAGRAIIQGLIDGIQDKVGDLTGLLQSVTDKIPDWKGPADKDAKLLEPAGRSIMQGLIDGIKSKISELRSTLQSITSAIASNFTGDLFGFENSHDFLANLVSTKGTLQKLKQAFHKLLDWGVAPQFLSSLFSNGGAGLILDLAKGDRITALTAASVFGDVNSLSSQLGGQVAQADIGPELRSQTRELRELNRKIARLPKDISHELNNAVGHGHRKAS